MKRHRKVCDTWAGRDVGEVRNLRRKATNLERYGAEEVFELEDFQERRKQTNLERYGAENLFSRNSSEFEAIQASLEGKRPVRRGTDNVFSRPEVKQKIREFWQRTHKVNGPQQVPEIRSKTAQTNTERYGGELLASPVLADKARKTNLERYGDEIPQRTTRVKEKTRASNLSRWGVPWTCMNPGVREKQLETHVAKYGSHFLASAEGRKAIREVIQERYGVDHWMQLDGAWESLVEVFQARYGVDHPLHKQEFLDKRYATLWRKYGNPWGPSPISGPNKFEQKVGKMAPSLMFTGDFKFWKWLPRFRRFKNPDFILPGPDPLHPKKGVRKVVEAFGDYWHSERWTGLDGETHQSETIEAYAEVGIDCLVVWLSEVQKDPTGVAARIATFLGGDAAPEPLSTLDLFAR